MTETNMEPLTTTINGAMAATGLGRTKIYEMVRNQRIDTVKVGRRTLVKVDSLRRLLEVA